MWGGKFTVGPCAWDTPPPIITPNLRLDVMMRGDASCPIFVGALWEAKLVRPEGSTLLDALIALSRQSIATHLVLNQEESSGEWY